MNAGTPTTAVPEAPSYSLWQLVRYVLALGTWGFGGPGFVAATSGSCS